MSHIFRRSANFGGTTTERLPSVVAADGVWVTDEHGKRYLDAAGGAVVVNIGHGVTEIRRAMVEQAERVSYVHATEFTTPALEELGEKMAPILPMKAPSIYPVSGGSEAVETAFKMARAFHLANGQPSRHKIISRWGSYHGNTRATLDASGRAPLRAPYLPWLGAGIHVPAVYEYRCLMSDHPSACGIAHANELERVILEQGAETVAAFIAEPIGGATLGATVPPDDYWPAVAEVCNRHGVLLIADEVMTGFGRTGTWFGVDHWAVQPDLIASGKGCSSGYWPLGLTVASGRVASALDEGGFVHGFTYSHHAVGAAVGAAVVERLVADDLVAQSRDKGARLKAQLIDRLSRNPYVGEVRGRGLLVGLELVADRDTKEPFDRAARVTERVVAACKMKGVLVYPGSGMANGTDGDMILFGPPFVISNSEVDQVVDITTQVIGAIETLPAT